MTGPDSAIIATAGHVDHGKTSLVRALTGLDLDTTPQERSRGLTIELGHTSLRLPTGQVVSVIDAPGHGDFLPTTIAGLAGCTTVLLTVAADEGWSQQTTQHVAVVQALAIAKVIVVVTKADRADPTPVLDDSLRRLEEADVAVMAHACVSTKDAPSVETLRATLSAVAQTHAVTPQSGPARVWVDRSFTKSGVGTIITGTLHAGSIRVGERLHTGQRPARVRGLQHHGAQVSVVQGPIRVAINLAGTGVEEVARGTLLSGEAHDIHAVVRGPVVTSHQHADVIRWPREVLVSVGTASFSAGLSVREGQAKIRLPRSYAVTPGDRMVLRDPGGRTILGGVTITQVGTTKRAVRPTEPAAPRACEPIAEGVQQLMDHLAEHPWQAPGAGDLKRWGIDGATLRRLGAEGGVLYLGQGLVLNRRVAVEAVERLRELDQPFSPGQARQAWGTSRAVALALLHHLDRIHMTSGDPRRGRYIVGH